MAKQRDLVKAFWVACAAAAGVTVCSVLVLHRSAADKPGPKVSTVAAFVDYVTASALFAGAFAGGASLMLGKPSKQRRYTLAELEFMALEQGLSPEVAAQIQLLREDADQ